MSPSSVLWTLDNTYTINDKKKDLWLGEVLHFFTIRIASGRETHYSKHWQGKLLQFIENHKNCKGFVPHKICCLQSIKRVQKHTAI